MEIKTIRFPFGKGGQFDRAVNEAAAEGWVLTRREVLMTPQPEPDEEGRSCFFYAEMVLPDKREPTPEPDREELLASMRVLQDHCNKMDRCSKCPIDNECGNSPPHEWKLTQEAPGHD